MYVAVDWSGARGPSLPGLQVAVCSPGNAPPSLVPPPRRYWTRSLFADWVAEQAADRGRVLFGFDFAFAFAYGDGPGGAYFPGRRDSPASALALWQRMETVCQGAPDFYGGLFYRDRQAPFAEYFCYRRPTGSRFDSKRFRLTETVCTDTYGARPTCVFKCVGAESVGAGSIAGMRFLHHFAHRTELNVSVWPFQPDGGRSVLVEIFPRLHYVQAGQNPRQWNKPRVLNAVMAHYHSDPLPANVAVQTEDQADALISAAALRRLASHKQSWQPKPMTSCAREYEGWIFGV